MATTRSPTIALGILMAIAASSAGQPASDPHMKFAAPTAQEETIFRPECPGEGTSSTWPPCQVAGTHGG
jgi:hypothetical protein